MSEGVKISWAGVKSNSDFILVETYSGYRGSAADPLGKQHLLRPDVGNHDLGIAVLDCLAHSRFLRPEEHREELFSLFDYELVNKRYSEWVTSLMVKFGYQTKRKLFKEMKSCEIESRSDLITIYPSHHEKLEGWSGDGIRQEDYVAIPAESSPVEVGAALRRALSRCT